MLSRANSMGALAKSLCIVVAAVMLANPVPTVSAGASAAAAASGGGAAAAAAASGDSFGYGHGHGASGFGGYEHGRQHHVGSAHNGYHHGHDEMYGANHHRDGYYYQEPTAYYEGGYIPQRPAHMGYGTGPAGNIRSLSKVPVVGKILYNPKQRQFRAAMKGEKQALQQSKANYRAALAAAPKVPGGKLPSLRKKEKLITDPALISNDNIVKHHNNVQLYKALIKNKNVPIPHSAPVYMPRYV